MNPNSILESAAEFLYRNGRLLDRHRFEHHFHGGAAADVIAALRAYQNEDGGFGQALEPDIRCPQSQPVPTEMALAIMDEMGHFDAELIEGIVRYLKQITVTDTGGFPLVFRSVNDYPHAPWWQTSDDRHASLNPTGSILGYLWKQQAVHSFKEEDWFQKSVEFVWSQIELGNQEGYHGLVQCLTFLQAVPDRARAEAQLHHLKEKLLQPGVIERDPEATGYVHKVLDWAPHPESYCAKLIPTEEMDKHLLALKSAQLPDGGWPINWPAVSPACELEWRGYVTVNRLLTLQAYGRL